jgi:O-antigen biosynthesis protein
VSDRPLVSFVLPNKNNEPVLDLFFDKLERHTTYPNIELIVVDDGSTDKSRDILRRWADSGRFPRFEVIEKGPSGIVETLNIGLDRARGEIIVRLDGDATIETPGWLERMLAFYRTDDRIGVVVPRVVLDSGQVNAFGTNIVCPEGFHDRGTRISHPVGRRDPEYASVERPHLEDTELGDEIAEVDTAIGCCMMFSRELSEQIGGIDTRFDPVYFEDIDFALSARRHGKKVFFFPEVEVLHRVTMRNPRKADSRLETWMWRARRAFGDLVPLGVRRRIARAAKIAEHDPEHTALLLRHYQSFREKWGFDPINPDMEAVLERYAGTEVCWAYDDELREAGREIIARYLARSGSGSGAPS